MSIKTVSYILAAISAVGAIAIPFGDPQFVDRAIALEVSFVVLTGLTFLGFRKALYACIPIGALVIIGNSLASPHVEIMMTFSKPLNAVLLIVGGYLLQVALIASTAAELVRFRLQGVAAQKPS